MSDSTFTIEANPIEIGNDWAAVIKWNGYDLNVPASAYRIDFRDERGDASALATITSADGDGIEIVAVDTLRLRLRKEQTRLFPSDGDVVFDIARTIGTSRMRLPGVFRWPCRLPVTRSFA